MSIVTGIAGCVLITLTNCPPKWWRVFLICAGIILLRTSADLGALP